MSPLRPIETRYKGYRFRSRLEARWAVFFDTLGVAYEYEPQGFNFDGTLYLPDFWLTTVRMWAEVKAVAFTGPEMRKARLLADQSGYPVLRLVGIPTTIPYWAVEPQSAEWGDEMDYLLDDQYIADEHRFYASTGLAEGEDWSTSYISPRTKAAYAAARGARFEHGEEGAGRL